MNKQFFQFIICMSISFTCFAQENKDWLLDKMPPNLEMDYALSALPPHLRAGATVYLLDPTKGYYLARKGTNGFSVFVNRTEWERTDFAPDVYQPISYDSAGSQVYLTPFFDVAAMRASGKFSPSQIKDSVVQRVNDGRYKPASRVGVSYMLEPLMRVHQDSAITTTSMPHFMFYAPYLDNNDIGGGWVAGGHQPFVVNSNNVLDKAHSIFNFIILCAGETEKAKILEEDKDLIQRLAEYKSYLKIESKTDAMHHQ